MAAALAATRLKVENPAGKWEPKDAAPAARLWAFTRSQFGDAQVLLIGVQLPLPVEVTLDATAAFEAWVGSQPEVASVFGPAAVRGLRRSLGLRLTMGRQLDDLRDAVLQRERRVALLYVSLHPPPVAGSLELPIAFLQRLNGEGLARLPTGSRMLVAGKPAADVALNQLVRTDTLISAPVALAVMVALLWVFMGSGSLGPSAGVATSVVIVAGGLAAFGEPLSTATAMTLPITVIVGLAYGIHMSAALERTRDLRAARRELSTPLFWAFVTTAAALMSFALSPIPALRSYAYASTSGVTLGYLAAYIVVPFLGGRRTGAGALRTRGRWERLPFRLYATAVRRPLGTVALWAAIAAVSLAGALRLRVEPNNYLGFFPQHHPTLVAHVTLDSAFGGSVPLFVLARSDTGTAFRQAPVRERLSEFLADAHRDAQIGPGFGPFVAAGRVSTLLEQWFEGRDPRYTRAVINIPLLDTPSARRLLRSLDSLAVAHSDGAIQLQVTGPLAAGLPLLQLLVDSQMWSLALTIAIVAAALVVVVRSWRLGLLLLVPNLLPLAAVAGAMGYLDIPLDFATVVVFSMVVGIAVDDTLQIAAAASAAAAPSAMLRVLRPVSLTSAIAVAGFAALLSSPFPVTERMGGLMALGLTIAWIADVTLTPLLIAWPFARASSRGLARSNRPEAD